MSFTAERMSKKGKGFHQFFCFNSIFEHTFFKKVGSKKKIFTILLNEIKNSVNLYSKQNISKLQKEEMKYAFFILKLF